MSREYRKREEENELIKRFEDHLRKKKAEFFDLDAYEEIIDFYIIQSFISRKIEPIGIGVELYESLVIGYGFKPVSLVFVLGLTDLQELTAF